VERGETLWGVGEAQDIKVGKQTVDNIALKHHNSAYAPLEKNTHTKIIIFFNIMK
jgi:hypothetical protein